MASLPLPLPLSGASQECREQWQLYNKREQDPSSHGQPTPTPNKREQDPSSQPTLPIALTLTLVFILSPYTLSGPGADIVS